MLAQQQVGQWATKRGVEIIKEILLHDE